MKPYAFGMELDGRAAKNRLFSTDGSSIKTMDRLSKTKRMIWKENGLWKKKSI